jgi:hypothetical protein
MTAAADGRQNGISAIRDTGAMQEVPVPAPAPAYKVVRLLEEASQAVARAAAASEFAPKPPPDGRYGVQLAWSWGVGLAGYVELTQRIRDMIEPQLPELIDRAKAELVREAEEASARARAVMGAVTWPGPVTNSVTAAAAFSEFLAELPAVARNRLYLAKIRSFDALLPKTDQELLDIHGLGKGSLQKIKEALARRGLQNGSASGQIEDEQRRIPLERSPRE